MVSTTDLRKINCVQRPYKYWNEQNIIDELRILIEILGYFPRQKILLKMGKQSLINAMSKRGGVNYYRNIFGFESIQTNKSVQKTEDCWNEETVISRLKPIIEKLGFFPSYNKLISMKEQELVDVIKEDGGINYFREKMGFGLIIKSLSCWNEENIIDDLKSIIKKLNHFPSRNELTRLNNVSLSRAIHRHGGFNYFREKMGFHLSLHEKYISELRTYIGKRGRASEKVIYKIITEWSINHGKPSPDFNVKLAKGNVLEFVCESKLKIGIDVTNTKASKASAFNTINRKWIRKNYHYHLDELWIVVFTNVLSPEDYNRMNIKSPDNVKIFSIEGFLEELDYSTEQYDVDKIDNLNKCTFHNKKELKNM